MNKQEMLNMAREIKKGVKRVSFILDNNKNTNVMLNSLEQTLYESIENLKKQLKETKDVWSEGCGKEYIDLKDGFRKDCCEKDGFCPTCEKQNKEFKEICLEVGI